MKEKTYDELKDDERFYDPRTGTWERKSAIQNSIGYRGAWLRSRSWMPRTYYRGDEIVIA